MPYPAADNLRMHARLEKRRRACMPGRLKRERLRQSGVTQDFLVKPPNALDFERPTCRVGKDKTVIRPVGPRLQPHFKLSAAMVFESANYLRRYRAVAPPLLGLRRRRVPVARLAPFQRAPDGDASPRLAPAFPVPDRRQPPRSPRPCLQAPFSWRSPKRLTRVPPRSCPGGTP